MEDTVTKPVPKQVVKFAPWIAALLILVYSVTVQFLLITSMENAFDSVKDFFQQYSSNFLLFEIPIPLILAVIFYFYSQHDRKRNFNLFLFSLVALIVVIIGIVIYSILFQFPLAHQKYFDLTYVVVAASTSLLSATISVLIRNVISKKATLQ